MKRRIISTVLALCLILMMVPMGASAAETTSKYFVGETPIFVEEDASGNGWEWDHSHSVLTLHGVSLSKSLKDTAIISLPTATIEAVGYNVIDGDKSAKGRTGITSDASLTFTGAGMIVIKNVEFGISASGALTYNSGVLDIHAATEGFTAATVTVKDGYVCAEVTDGLAAAAWDLYSGKGYTQTGGTVDLTSVNGAGLLSDHDVTVSGGVLTVSSSGDDAPAIRAKNEKSLVQTVKNDGGVIAAYGVRNTAIEGKLNVSSGVVIAGSVTETDLFAPKPSTGAAVTGAVTVAKDFAVFDSTGKDTTHTSGEATKAPYMVIAKAFIGKKASLPADSTTFDSVYSEAPVILPKDVSVKGASVVISNAEEFGSAVTISQGVKEGSEGTIFAIRTQGPAITAVNFDAEKNEYTTTDLDGLTLIGFNTMDYEAAVSLYHCKGEVHVTGLGGGALISDSELGSGSVVTGVSATHSCGLMLGNSVNGGVYTGVNLLGDQAPGIMISNFSKGITIKNAAVTGVSMDTVSDKEPKKYYAVVVDDGTDVTVTGDSVIGAYSEDKAFSKRPGLDGLVWKEAEKLSDKFTQNDKDAKGSVVFLARDRSALPFTDVSEKDWFYNDVKFAYSTGLIYGITEKSFAPETTTSRGMLVAILWRMEGNPKVNPTYYSDVKQTAYYAEAISWASQNKIVTGYGKDKFGPNDPITREQLAAILYRYAKYKGVKVDDNDPIGALSFASTFKDASKIDSYAAAPMQWAYNRGIIYGTSSNTLSPKGLAKRCQIAAFLHRFSDLI